VAELRRKWSTIPKTAPTPTKQQRLTINRHDTSRRTIFVADADRDDGKRYVVTCGRKTDGFG
jgi:hypothetical protein